MFTPPSDPLVLPVTESSQVGDARRNVTALADALGFDETRRGEAAIVATELANNLMRHAKAGQLIVQSTRRGAATGIELIAVDRGPGIPNVSRALRDGYSTAGTPGSGLGAIRRLSSEFDIYSVAGSGTTVLSRLWPAAAPADAGWEFGVICLPKVGEQYCGDAWSVGVAGDRLLVLVADGLGHGALASTASRQAVQTFRANLSFDPVMLMQSIHQSLRSTRGCAAAIVEICESRETRFVGVGNIAAAMLSPIASQSMVSHNGTLGAEARRFQAFAYPQPGPESLLIMHSDGLSTQWQLDNYPGLRMRHPSLIASVLYRDFRRERDDVTVLVARRQAAAEGVA